MDPGNWRKLFDSIRPVDQNVLVIALTSGLEIAVQQLGKVEDECILIRGRVGGQAETGRVFLVPFDKINAVYVNRLVLSEEVDLFSPSVTPERKEEIARTIKALEEKQKEMARQAEAAKREGQQPGVSPDLKRQLEALREAAGFAPAPGSAPGTAALPAPVSRPGMPAPPSPAPPTSVPVGPGSPPARPGSPPRITLPNKPIKPQ